MSSKFTVSGTDTKITFEWTAPTTLIQSVVDDCAEFECRNIGIDFSSLTNSQKLTIVEHFIRDAVLGAANALKDNRAITNALETEKATKYEL